MKVTLSSRDNSFYKQHDVYQQHQNGRIIADLKLTWKWTLNNFHYCQYCEIIPLKDKDHCNVKECDRCW